MPFHSLTALSHLVTGRRNKLTFMFLVASVAVSVFFPADHAIRSPGSSSPSQLLQTDSSWGSKVDGTCVIDIFHKDGSASDAASFLEISRAAKRLDNACVARQGQRVQGGWIKDIGMFISIISSQSLYSNVHIAACELCRWL